MQLCVLHLVVEPFTARDEARLAENRDFCLPHLHSTPPLRLGGFPSEYCHNVWYGRTKMGGYPTVKKLWRYVYSFRQNTHTDRRTEKHCTTVQVSGSAVSVYVALSQTPVTYGFCWCEWNVRVNWLASCTTIGIVTVADRERRDATPSSLTAVLQTTVRDLSRRIKSAKTRGDKSQRYTSNMTAVKVSRPTDPSIAAHVDMSAAAALSTPKRYTSKCNVLATRPFYRTSCGSRAAAASRTTASDIALAVCRLATSTDALVTVARISRLQVPLH